MSAHGISVVETVERRRVEERVVADLGLRRNNDSIEVQTLLRCYRWLDGEDAADLPPTSSPTTSADS